MKILIKAIIITRVHGNKRHTPRHAITHNDTEKIVSFIKNFAEKHGILLPGRVPGVRDYEKAKLLPSSMSKRYVYSMYKESCDGRVVSESSFQTAWKLYVPHIYRNHVFNGRQITCYNFYFSMSVGAWHFKLNGV